MVLKEEGEAMMRGGKGADRQYDREFIILFITVIHSILYTNF